jgi:predicted ATPase
VAAALTGMRFYSFAVGTLREASRPAASIVLGHTGEHLGDVLGSLAAAHPEVSHRLDAYLNTIVPGITGAGSRPAGEYMSVAFRAAAGTENDTIEFGPATASDGTIHAAAVLAALFQPAALDGRIPLIGIENPESALHPAAVGVLFDALTEASGHVQVIVATQSPDLLDRDDLDVSAVRAVAMDHGLTVIGEIDQASQHIVRDGLYTVGELMRSGQLSPEPSPGAQVPEPGA